MNKRGEWSVWHTKEQVSTLLHLPIYTSLYCTVLYHVFSYRRYRHICSKICTFLPSSCPLLFVQPCTPFPHPACASHTPLLSNLPSILLPALCFTHGTFLTCTYLLFPPLPVLLTTFPLYIVQPSRSPAPSSSPSPLSIQQQQFSSPALSILYG